MATRRTKRPFSDEDDVALQHVAAGGSFNVFPFHGKKYRRAVTEGSNFREETLSGYRRVLPPMKFTFSSGEGYSSSDISEAESLQGLAEEKSFTSRSNDTSSSSSNHIKANVGSGRGCPISKYSSRRSEPNSDFGSFSLRQAALKHRQHSSFTSAREFDYGDNIRGHESQVLPTPSSSLIQLISSKSQTSTPPATSLQLLSSMCSFSGSSSSSSLSSNDSNYSSSTTQRSYHGNTLSSLSDTSSQSSTLSSISQNSISKSDKSLCESLPPISALTSICKRRERGEEQTALNFPPLSPSSLSSWNSSQRKKEKQIQPTNTNSEREEDPQGLSIKSYEQLLSKMPEKKEKKRLRHIKVEKNRRDRFRTACADLRDVLVRIVGKGTPINVSTIVLLLELALDFHKKQKRILSDMKAREEELDRSLRLMRWQTKIGK